jgi:hemolysin III
MLGKAKEPVSFYTHFAGAVASAAGLVLLVTGKRESLAHLATSIIYGSTLVFLFTASSCYHAFKDEENGNSMLRKLDHLAIFLLIAGTYTPICYAYLSGGWRWGILIAQWGLVFFGVFFSLFYLSAPRIISTSIYVLMGWLLVIPIKKIIAAVPNEALLLIVSGGVAYTAGAVIYAVKKPDPVPGKFGFHEIFHLFILLGAALHFTAIYLYC